MEALRDLAPLVLGVLVRRYRDFAACEDAVQEALVAASQQWPSTGVPANPRAWLVRVATRRLTDEIRAATARRLREDLVVAFLPVEAQIELAAGASERDDTLDLYFMCCHPALSPSSQIALTLRAVGGLTTPEIARAFLVPEATMAQRLSRAKQILREASSSFERPDGDARLAHLGQVLHVLYLVFSEGYAASSGDALTRVDLSTEAIRVTRLLARLLPASEVNALLALMLLTDARRAARTGESGELIPLDAQDRTRWDRALIAEGTQLVDAIFASGEHGPFAIQAAIAALHDAAPSTDATDWPQIAALYTALLAHGDNPMVRLSRAIAIGMAESPRIGLAAIDDVAADARMTGNHRIDAARAHLLERAGELSAAVEHYRRAAVGTASEPERAYLLVHAARLTERKSP